MKEKRGIGKIFYIIKKGLLYLPMYCSLLWYCIRYRTSPTILIKTNPGFPYGGLICPKTEIFKRFQKNRQEYEKFFAKTVDIRINESKLQRREKIKTFIQKNKLTYPLILKPDESIAGVGLCLIQDEPMLISRIDNIQEDFIVQEYIDRKYELGIFYIKYPDKKEGEIRGITNKNIITRNKKDPKLVIPSNEVIYKDESEKINRELEDIFNAISDIEGFYFGRFDIRVKDMKEFFAKGKDFKILEVNVGAHDIALQAFDPKYNIWERYSILFEQLRIAFAIAKKNVHILPKETLSQERKEFKKFIEKNIKIFKNLHIKD